MLQFERVSVHYGKNRVLTDVTLQVGAAEIAVVEPNALQVHSDPARAPQVCSV